MSQPSADLLVELGTEEIPAGYLARALAGLGEQVQSALAAARLPAASVEVLGTPRRLAFIARGLPPCQADLSERVVGPPAHIAFDADGKPTRAALGFAKKNGVAPESIARAEVPGKSGEYAVCMREERGARATDVVPGVIREVLGGIAWPKSMRWGTGLTAYVRPVHWLVALLGGDVVAVSFAGVSADRHTRGHRFLSEGTLSLGCADDYVPALEQAHVIVAPENRRLGIKAELSRIESEVGATVRVDDELVAEVANLVELPVAICGEFDREFLDVPEAAIVSAMRSHQRYFAMQDGTGALVNRFVTIAGTITRDPAVVRKGNERVLAARLSDARFFYTEDQKQSLDSWAKRLDGVVFQSKLGSVGDKARRVAGAAAWLAGEVDANPDDARRASELCKADLVTSMVYEFPDLQGVMGRRYAELAGESAAVSTAIEEHYLPRGSGGELPTTDTGAVVAVADRIDTIVGCFAAGLAPTGSADPYGLRRAAVGVLAIVLERGWNVPLSALVTHAAEALTPVIAVPDATRAAIAEFFATRLKGLLGALPTDCVDAALAAGADDVPDARARAEAVAKLRDREDFEPLAAAFKRVANILRGESVAAAPDPKRFTDAEENALWSSFSEVRQRVQSHLAAGDYHSALQVLAGLKGPVDKFFDSVLVMDKDEAVKQNRLALLGQINAAFTRIADFRQLAV